MSFQYGYSMETVKTVFGEEIVSAGGTISDSYSNENCLLTRSILPWIADVRSGDMIQGGVHSRPGNMMSGFTQMFFDTFAQTGQLSPRHFKRNI